MKLLIRLRLLSIQSQGLSINSGKRFEGDIQLACKEQGVFCLRLKDAGSFNHSDAQRSFTSKNPADFVLFCNGLLWVCEAKTRKTSLSFDSITQREDLKKLKSLNQYDDRHFGVLVYFSKPQRSFWVESNVIEYLSEQSKKSFNSGDMDALIETGLIGVWEIPWFTPKGKRKARMDLGYLRR